MAGGGRARAGIRYFTLVVADVGTPHDRRPTRVTIAWRSPPPSLAVPGMGWCFVADPDGNWVELVGPV